MMKQYIHPTKTILFPILHCLLSFPIVVYEVSFLHEHYVFKFILDNCLQEALCPQLHPHSPWAQHPLPPWAHQQHAQQEAQESLQPLAAAGCCHPQRRHSWQEAQELVRPVAAACHHSKLSIIPTCFVL